MQVSASLLAERGRRTCHALASRPGCQSHVLFIGTGNDTFSAWTLVTVLVWFIELSFWKLLSYCRLLSAKSAICGQRSRGEPCMGPTLRLLPISAALKPCTCRSGVDLRLVFYHILTLLDFHLSLPELANQVSNPMIVDCVIRTCFSSFSSRRTSATSSFKDSSFFDHFATISAAIVRCLTWSSPAARLIAAFRILRSASPTRVIDLHFIMSNRRIPSGYSNTPSLSPRTCRSPHTM